MYFILQLLDYVFYSYCNQKIICSIICTLVYSIRYIFTYKTYVVVTFIVVIIMFFSEHRISHLIYHYTLFIFIFYFSSENGEVASERSSMNGNIHFLPCLSENDEFTCISKKLLCRSWYMSSQEHEVMSEKLERGVRG